jgi:phage tail tape-measure protein
MWGMWPLSIATAMAAAAPVAEVAEADGVVVAAVGGGCDGSRRFWPGKVCERDAGDCREAPTEGMAVSY